MMTRILGVTAVAEAATGLFVFAFPAITARALFDAEIVGAGILMCRIGAIAIIGLGIACWPGNSGRQPRFGMMAYGALVLLYLLYIGMHNEFSGIMLWPAVVLHVIILVLLALAPREDVSRVTGRVES